MFCIQHARILLRCVLCVSVFLVVMGGIQGQGQGTWQGPAMLLLTLRVALPQ